MDHFRVNLFKSFEVHAADVSPLFTDALLDDRAILQREVLTHPRPCRSDPEHQVQAWCYWSGGGFVSRVNTPGRVCECLPRHPSGCGALHLFTLCQLQIAYRDPLINGQRNVMRWWATVSSLYFASARVNRTALRQPHLFLTATLLQLSGGHISKIKTGLQFVLGANQQMPATC